MAKKQEKKVLQNYKKVGSKFIPPITHQLGPIKPISYGRQILPELIWWDVIIDKESHKFAADLAVAIATYFKEQEDTSTFWGFVSDYSKLNEDEFTSLKKSLNDNRMLERLQNALADFLELYPECPLVGFFDCHPHGGVDISYIDRFEKRYAEAEDKRSRAGILIQSQVVYMGFAIGKFRVFEGLALADFPEIEKYPETELSLKVGASVCATVNLFSEQMLPDYQDDVWVKYFWNRSFTIRPIKMDHLTS